jgi:hypothetical protein
VSTWLQGPLRSRQSLPDRWAWCLARCA